MVDDKKYLNILLQIKNELNYTKHKVIMSTNKEIILMYYRIGLKLKENNSWGNSFIDNLAKDLKITYPNIKGMSSRNLRYMQKFATIYKDDEFLQEVLAKLTWYHNIILMDRVKKIEEKKWYAINSIENGWSSNALIHQISTNLYSRQAIIDKKITNFKNTLPLSTSSLSLELIKDPYIFDFISTKKSMKEIEFEYTGVLNKNSDIQNIEILNYHIKETIKSSTIPNSYQDDGIFSTYYLMAYNKLKELTLDEKIGQLILARYPEESLLENLEKYKLGGYIFFEKDFKNKTKSEVKEMINNVQNNSDIPLLIAVDEEGGKIVRVSSNQNLVSERFKTSRELYSLGGMDKIKEDTINKSNLLYDLGINLNLAPVVDVSTNPDDYMYERSLGQSTKITSQYAEIVIKSSKGLGVSYTLKHFPGYGNNLDTHTGTSVDKRSYESILEYDIPPFESGINAGAEAILVSHNIVNSIDPNNPSSLSPKIHNLLRNELNFTGVIITDDLYMGATKDIADATVLAVLAGNNIIITTEYIDGINSIKNAIDNEIISEDLIDKLAFKVLAWKYYKGLMLNEK